MPDLLYTFSISLLAPEWDFRPDLSIWKIGHIHSYYLESCSSPHAQYNTRNT